MGEPGVGLALTGLLSMNAAACDHQHGAPEKGDGRGRSNVPSEWSGIPAEGRVMVMVAVEPGVMPVILKEKKPWGKVTPGLPVQARLD